ARERVHRLVEIVVGRVDAQPVGRDRELIDRLPLRGRRIGQALAALREIGSAERVRELRARIGGQRAGAGTGWWPARGYSSRTD
ncbi:hypothetical protein INQ16_25695, partial [Escherichia coli]|nr:hypothetical protein [Escherichia coli]